MLTTLQMTAIGLDMVALLFLVIALIIYMRALGRLRRHTESARIEMDRRVGEQVTRVDGLVRQYRQLSRDFASKMKVMDSLGDQMRDLSDYVHEELSERVDEVDLSVSAVLDVDDDDPETWPVYEERPTQVVATLKPSQSKQTKPTKQANGLAAVDTAAKNGKTAGSQKNAKYSRYQELRDQGYSAAEATAMLNRENGNGRKRNG